MQVQKSITEIKKEIANLKTEIQSLTTLITKCEPKIFGVPRKSESLPSGLAAQFIEMKNQRQRLVEEYSNALEAALQRVKIVVTERDNSNPVQSELSYPTAGILEIFKKHSGEIDY